MPVSDSSSIHIAGIPFAIRGLGGWLDADSGMPFGIRVLGGWFDADPRDCERTQKPQDRVHL